ncbi:TPA: O-antigen ligase family protein [Clostridium perfringens]
MIISLLINSILTLRVLYTYPLAAKILATGISSGEQYLLKGASGFDVLYSTVIFIPSLLFLISNLKGIKKIFLIVLLCILLVYIYNCAYATAILVTVITIFVYLFLNSNKIIKIFLFIPIILLGIFIINENAIYNLLIYFSNIINIEQVSIRFHDIANMIKYSDTGADSLSRLSLYMDSIKAFLISPFIGVFYFEPNYQLSGHSTILDILGGTGLIGFFSYICTIIYSYKSSIKYILNNRYRNCIFSSYIAFIFISILNPQFASPNVLIILLIIVPVAPSIIYKQ